MSFIQEEIPFVTTIRIFDLIDIAILSVAIYQLLWIMRKSSSGRVIKGVLVLIVAIAAADWLQLTATSWVLNWVVEWGILALVILFQPEIRRVLERLGSGKLSSMFSSQRPASPYDMETAIRETVEAYTSMSKDKVGALMVFERKNLLDDVIKTGTPPGLLRVQRAVEESVLEQGPPPRRRGHRAGGAYCGGGLYAPPVRQCESEPGSGHAPPGGHRHERALRRGGGHRL